MPASVTMKELLETGVHFGHRTTKWNPKMKPYIFTERNGIHILDLQQSLANLHQYADMLREMTAAGKTMLFVGTKRQAQEAIAREAERCGMPYINTRWLGGTLTNWRTIKDRIETMKKLEKRAVDGSFDRLPKKEVLMLNREIIKLNDRLGGLRNLRKLPDMLIVVDTRREATAMKEANTLNIPVMALADTNSNPQEIDFVIPANDDAVRAIKLVVGVLATAIQEGRQTGDKLGVDMTAPNVPDFMDKDAESDADLLGASTLKNIQRQNIFADETPAS